MDPTSSTAKEIQMPQFKVLYLTGFGENEAIIRAESAEAAQSQFEAELAEDGRFGSPSIASVEPYTPTYGQTLIMGVSRGGYGGVYGYGEDLAAAKAGFRKNGGVLSRGYSVIEFDAETDFIGVTGMGGYRWMGNPPTITEVAPR